MEKDTEATNVLFRVDKWGQFKGDITAVFPDIEADPTGKPLCYAHIGQHSACTWEWVHSKTRPAKPEEYRELKDELEAIGYTLRVMQRRVRH